MGEKRKKKKRGTGRGTSKLPLLLSALFFLAAVISVSFYILFTQTSGAKKYSYEEFHSRPSALSTAVIRIDHAIYECLRRNRVPQENIRFVTVAPRREKRMDWDFTELLVKVPKGHPFGEIDQSLGKALSALKPEVNHKSENVSEAEKVFYVFALGVCTHKITLASGEDQKKQSKELPRIAIIIDDIGNDPGLALSFTQLGFPVTLSLLPLGVHTGVIVRLAKERGCEYMLHLPMEPKDYPLVDPGPGSLFRKMEDDQIREILNDDLKRVPGAKGVNNHMGSEFTEDERKMSVVLQEIKKRDLFYVDSRTTSQTVAYTLAKRIGVPAASRAMFLDNDLSTQAMEFQLERLLAVARESGAAIGIGHPHKETLGFLRKYSHKLTTEAEVVPVSEIVK
jgi:polysaccharide deacetylase 2 family uncharacterized protein YibQ